MASEVIKLNLIPKGDMPVFHASQFDTGRLITCELYRGEDAYTVPEGYTVELHCRKVDNNIVTMESTLINDNVVTFTSTEQLTACNGKNLCEVAILDEGYRIGTLNFILEVEIDPLKGGITSTSEIYNLETQIEEITTEIVGENYYTKTETDALLDDKADSDSVYTKTETDTKLALKANAADVYTKSQVDTALALKADAADVYTKSQVDTALALKADAADVYTKSQVDTALALKANAADVYTKTQVDTALALKADAADVYTKTEVYNKTETYTQAQVDTLINNIFPTLTATGAIASFRTALAKPLVSVTAAEGAATVTLCGVNMFDKTSGQVLNGYFGVSGYIKPNGDTRSVFVKCNPNTTYTVSKTAGQRFSVAWTESTPELSTVSTNGNIVDNTASSITITTGATAKYIVAYVFHASYDSGTADEMIASVQIAEGTDTTYHAYTGTTVPVADATTLITESGSNHVSADVGDITVQYKYMSI